MRSKLFRRTLFSLLAMAVVLGPAVSQAAVRGARAGEAPAVRAEARASGLLSLAWRELMGLFAKNGASIDPSGSSGTGGGTGTNGNGASIDPSGATGSGDGNGG